MQKIIDDIKTFSQTHKIKVLPLMISVATLLFVVLGAIGVLYVQSPLNQTQTIVNQASTGTGLVILTSQLVSPTVFTQGAPSTVDLKFNSQGAQLSGLQVRVKVTANSGTPTLTVSQTSGLKANYQQVEKVSDGYIVTMIVSAVNLGQSFTSTAATTFARLTIPLAAPGQIKLNYDRTTSIATIANSTDTTDQLRTPVDVTYTVGTTQTATPTPMPTATPRVSPSASPMPTATPRVSPTPAPTVVPSPVPTASPVSSTGVVTGVQLTTPKPGQIVATWDEYPGTNVYKVNGFKDITQGYSTRRDTSSTRMELNALTRCVTYNVRVDAYDKSGKVIAMSEFYPIVVSNSIPCK